MLDPTKRLGASDPVGYPSLRSHPFFEGINFDTLHEQTPPPIYPYLPRTSDHEEHRSKYRVSIKLLRKWLLPVEKFPEIQKVQHIIKKTF